MSTMPNSSRVSTNPYSAKSTDYSLKKSCLKPENSQKGDKTKTKTSYQHETETRVQTKRVREESTSPVPIKSSSYTTVPPKMGAGRQVCSPSKLQKQGHHTGDKGSLSSCRSAHPEQQKPGYAAPPHPYRDCPPLPHTPRHTPNGLAPYSPDEIDNLGKDWMTESIKDPIAWKQEDIDLALNMAYSRLGLQNLRPSSEHWTVGMLMDHITMHAPDVLDPLLRGKKDCYASGLISSISGFVPDHDLKAKCAKNVKSQGPKSDSNSGKKTEGRGTGKSEGSRR